MLRQPYQDLVPRFEISPPHLGHEKPLLYRTELHRDKDVQGNVNRTRNRMWRFQMEILRWHRDNRPYQRRFVYVVGTVHRIAPPPYKGETVNPEFAPRIYAA